MVRASWPELATLLIAAVAVVRANPNPNPEDNLIRRKKRMASPTEGTDGKCRPYSKVICCQDFDNGKGNIRYSLEGVGASQYPFNLFVVDPITGFIRVTGQLDREVIDTYNLTGVATYTDGTLAENKIDIRFKVGDQNDNPPVFAPIPQGAVDELSPIGTSIMKISATDADEPGTENSQIAYSIVGQDPPGDMFYIDADGTLRVKNQLDRETVDQYTLTVKGQDLNGKPEGLTATSTVTIKIRDVNDNLPTLEKDEYGGSIEENTQGVEVMRLKAEDLDLEGTENWEAVYDIVKGNEAGYFSIKTDPVTNEGILMLDKAVDYEKVKDLDLGIAVRNKNAPFGSGATGGISIGGGGGGGGSGGGGSGGGGSGGGGSGGGGGGGGGGAGGGATGASGGSWWQSGGFKTYPVKIKVKNQPEGAHFDPKVKAIPISEGDTSFNINDVITRYPAIDGDTGKPAENVKYVKGSDPGNWLIIDPETADIRLSKMPDRESPHLVNGTYYAEVLSISEDMPGKTSTGTIAIQVEDFNDHCPTLTSNVQTMCTTADAVVVSAKDEDDFPNGPPFDFAIVPEGTEGKWQVEYLNDTAAILRAQETMWPGSYEVEFLVKDEQGQACPEPQKVKVQVCTCEDGVVCGKRGANGQPSKGSEFGPAGIGLLFLGLLLLALIPLLLLFCQCGAAAGLPGGFTEMPFDTKSHLINYRTEGQGENTEVPLLNMPTQMEGDLIKVDTGMGTKSALPMEQSVTSMDVLNVASFAGGNRDWAGMSQNRGSGFYSEFESRESAGGRGLYDGMALPHHFLAQYYGQKAASGNENAGVKDGLLVYDYEGQGSPAGSVGCCSLLESDNDLQFLNDLGPKFKTLAEVCGGKTIQTEVEPVLSAPPSTTISTLTSGSSMITAPQLSPPPKVQPTISTTEQTVVKKKSERPQVVKESMSTVNGAIANQGQMILLQQQQPMYYTTAPMLQPMHYVVQPQVQNTMLLAEAPATNLQGMVLVNGTHTGPAPGMVVQGQTVMSSGPSQGASMVLVESSGIQGEGANLIHGNLSASQPMMVVEGKVPAGTLKKLKGNQTCLVQGGTLQQGGLSGSQRVLMVGGATGSGGQLVQEQGGLSGSQTVLMVGGATGNGGQLVQEQGGLTGSQRVLMVGGATGSGGQLLQEQGGLSGSQTVLMVGGATGSGGQLLQEQGGLSGSQTVLMVGGGTGNGGKLVQETHGLSQMGNISHNSSTTVNTTPTYRKVVKETRQIH